MSKALEQAREISGMKSQSSMRGIILAELLARGYDFEEVAPFVTSTPQKAYLSVSQLSAAKNALFGLPWFVSLIERLQSMGVSAGSEEQKVSTEKKKQKKLNIRDKDAILDEIVKRYEETGDTKLLAQAADLQRMKQEETRQDVRHVMHVLPARCNVCPCFIFAKEKYPDIKTLKP